MDSSNLSYCSAASFNEPALLCCPPENFGPAEVMTS